MFMGVLVSPGRISRALTKLDVPLEIYGRASFCRFDNSFKHRGAVDRIIGTERVGGFAYYGVSKGLQFGPLDISFREPLQILLGVADLVTG